MEPVTVFLAGLLFGYLSPFIPVYVLMLSSDNGLGSIDFSFACDVLLGVIIRDREAAEVGKKINRILEELRRLRDTVKRAGDKY